MSDTKTKKQKVNAVWSVTSTPEGFPMLRIVAWTLARGGRAPELAGNHHHALDPASVGLPVGYFICKIFDMMQDEMEAKLDVQIINARARDMASLVCQYELIVQRKAAADRAAEAPRNNTLDNTLAGVGVGGLLGAVGMGGTSKGYPGGSSFGSSLVTAYGGGGGGSISASAAYTATLMDFEAKLRAAELAMARRGSHTHTVTITTGGTVSGAHYDPSSMTVNVTPRATEVRPDSVMEDDDLGVVVHTYLNGSTVILKRKDTGESVMITAAQYDFIRASVSAVKKARAEARLTKGGAEPDDVAADEDEDAMVW